MSAISPPEVPWLLIFGADTSATLLWPNMESGTRFDVVSGNVSTLRGAGGVSNVSCVANNVKGESTLDARGAPSSNQGYFYLVRAQSVCGSGGYGRSSAGAQRLPTSDCP